jgi:hypothetical protein
MQVSCSLFAEAIDIYREKEVYIEVLIKEKKGRSPI